MTVGAPSVRARLADRLRGRRDEIEQAVLDRVRGLEHPARTRDPAYEKGLRSAVVQAVAFALDAVERTESRPAPIPIGLFAQARHAAREGVTLSTVLRRYLAGYTLLGEFTCQAAEQEGLLGDEGFVRLRRDQAALLDRLVATISEEYGREPTPLERASSVDRLRELVQRLLAGELVDAADLGYDLGGWHVAVVAGGERAGDALRELAHELGVRLLAVYQNDDCVWVWLGGRKRIGSFDIASLAGDLLPPGVVLALGEPGRDVEGWRFTHRQAERAWLLTGARRAGVTRYADIMLLASVLQDDVLCTTLHELFLTPLGADRDGSVLRETLRAYIAAGCNVSSSAAALGVSRTTVTKRLRRAESRLGRPVSSCIAEIATALCLADTAATAGQNDAPRPPRRITLMPFA